jgi:hypothetical protein
VVRRIVCPGSNQMIDLCRGRRSMNERPQSCRGSWSGLCGPGQRMEPILLNPARRALRRNNVGRES